MASVSAIRDGLRTRLATITGLRAYDVWPDQVHAPAAMVQPVRGRYKEALGGVPRLTFRVVLAAAPVQRGLARGEDVLDPYLDDTGATSIKAALEGDKTLGGIVASLHAVEWDDYGLVAIGGVDYVGASVEVEVWP
jgi:hypothetical protein